MKPINLSGECSIYEILGLHQKIMENWKVDRALALDLSQVTEIDSSFIQLLMSCKKTAEKHQQTFELLNAPALLDQKTDEMLTSEFFSAQAIQNIDDSQPEAEAEAEAEAAIEQEIKRKD